MSEVVYALAVSGHLADYSYFTGVDYESGVKVNGTEARYTFNTPAGVSHALSRFMHRLSPEEAKADFYRAIKANVGAA